MNMFRYRVHILILCAGIAFFACDDDETPSVCQPQTCDQLEKQCGTWDDGCDGQVDCGFCSDGSTCRDDGVCEQSGCNEIPCVGLTYCDHESGDCLHGCDDDEQCIVDEVCNIETHECECIEGLHRCDDACLPDNSIQHCGESCEPCPTDPLGSPTCDGLECGIECVPDAEWSAESETCECLESYHGCSGQCVSSFSVSTCGSRCEPCPTDPNGSAFCDGISCGIECDEGFFLFGGVCLTICRTTVDSEGDVGRFVSLALDSDDRPHLGYRDYTNENLKYATLEDGAWEVFTVDTRENSGWNPSLAIDSTGAPHIVHTDFRRFDLLYVFWNGEAWELGTVDASGLTGLEPSLALSSTDEPHITYRDISNEALKYATRNGTEWTRTIVDTGEHVGIRAPLALDSTDAPHFSYLDVSEHDLLYASRSGETWDIQVVDDGDIGYGSSLALDSSDHPHISYRTRRNDDTNSHVKYAFWNGEEWFIEIVDGDSNVASYTALALDSTGHPHIAYYDQTEGDLKYASFNGSDWEIFTIDAEGDAGTASSLALDSEDRPHIAYYETTNTELRYAWFSTDEFCAM